MDKKNAIRHMYISSLNTQAQDWIIERLEKLESALRDTTEVMIALYEDKDIAAGYPYILAEQNRNLYENE